MAEEIKRARDEVERKKRKEEKRKRQAVIEAGPETVAASPAQVAVAQVAATPVAFLFPGQGSQAVGMLKVRACDRVLLQSPSSYC